MASCKLILVAFLYCTAAGDDSCDPTSGSCANDQDDAAALLQSGLNIASRTALNAEQDTDDQIAISDDVGGEQLLEEEDEEEEGEEGGHLEGVEEEHNEGEEIEQEEEEYDSEEQEQEDKEEEREAEDGRTGKGGRGSSGSRSTRSRPTRSRPSRPKSSGARPTTGGEATMRDDDRSAGPQSSVGLSCQAETAIRTALMNDLKVKRNKEASMIRAIFHDAVDANNLLTKNTQTGKWEPVEGNYGGVDGCLYSPLSDGDKGVPEPSHNRNIPARYAFSSMWCRELCKRGGLAAGTKLCNNMADCEVDITVLGSLLAVEKAGGPRIPMTWGRKKGDCSTMIVTGATKKGVVSHSKLAQLPALRFAPSLTGIDDGESFRTAFDRLGFTADDQTALMGAHTFGKVAVCAGGLNGIEHGNFCNDPAKLDPPLTSANWAAPKGQCSPQLGKVTKCWTEETNKGTKRLRPVTMRQGKGLETGFGDGGFFDRTPETFDTDYFKLFQGSTYSDKDICCGKVKAGMCDRKGNMARITSRDASGKATATQDMTGQECSVSWCRSDRKGRTHMKSTRSWHEAKHDFVKRGERHGTTKRIIRLAGDWALLERADTRAAVNRFARDQSAFFSAFETAFTKVMNKGYNNLDKCSA